MSNDVDEDHPSTTKTARERWEQVRPIDRFSTTVIGMAVLALSFALLTRSGDPDRAEGGIAIEETAQTAPPRPTTTSRNTITTAPRSTSTARPATATSTTSPPPPAARQWTEEDIEWKLATIDAGRDVALDDPTIEVFAIRLDRLEAACSEDRTYLADMSVRAAELISDSNGSPMSIANTMNGVIGYIEGLQKPEHNCQEDYARYVSDHA